MGIIQSIKSLIGNENLQRLSSGQGNFQDPNSPDHQNMQNMVANADPSRLQRVFVDTAQQMDPQQYANHLGGGNAFAALGSDGLATIASVLVGHLNGGAGAPLAGKLLGKIPGITTTDPSQMGPSQVAALAQYAQQNFPYIFGQVAAKIGQQQPGLLNSLLGKDGMAAGAAALASHFVKM